MEHVERLKARLAEIDDLARVSAVLEWDQATYMPPGGGAARAEQLATLGLYAHRMLVDDQTARLLAAADAEVQGLGLGPDDDAVCLLRLTRRDYDQAILVPAEVIADTLRTASLAREVWVTARAQHDFATFAPWLSKNLALARRQVDYLGYAEHPGDALLQRYDPGMTVDRLRVLFGALRAGLTPLVRAVAARPDAVDDSVLMREYDEEAQLRFASSVARSFGYDFFRGRLDLTTHPFETAFSRDDVRITTRVMKNFLSAALMGTMHEAGHGLYEQNVAPALARSPLSRGASAGLHESQSRLWENVVGRSRGFWSHFLALAQQAFPRQLGDVDPETLYRAFNKACPSLIRVEADELTYNMHIMVRFDLESELLTGRLSVDDLPEAWNAAMHEYLGVAPSNDAEGVLQDTHWAIGAFSSFPSYTIGNVLSVQFYDAALRERPTIHGEIAQGEFGGLLGWLREHIYGHGRKYDPDDLVVRATGQPLDVQPYLRYLRDKFGTIYGLSSADLRQ